MGILEIGCVIGGAGLVGGFFNALTSDNGFLIPRQEFLGGGARIVRPGFLGNMAVGSLASVVSWLLYSADSSNSIGSLANRHLSDLSLGTIGAAVLIGLSGARWLSNEIDKRLLRASIDNISDQGLTLSAASPADILHRTVK